MADARPAASANLRMIPSLVVGVWKQMKCLQRQTQADWGFEAEVAIVGDGEVTIADGDRIAIVPARVSALRDPAGEHDRALHFGVRSIELGDIVAEIRRDRAHGRIPSP